MVKAIKVILHSTPGRILISWDFLAPVLVAYLVWQFAPALLPSSLTKDIYSIGVNVLAILFSVYFAALAVIISSSTDDFVQFMEEENDYTLLIRLFKVCLFVLFFALLYSIVAYVFTSAWLTTANHVQRVEYLTVFVFLFAWGLCSALSSTQHAIMYANTRVEYIRMKEALKMNGADKAK